MNDELGPRQPKVCVWSCLGYNIVKGISEDEEATAKRMYRKASEQASFARRRGNRQPGSSLVLSETRKALAWLGMAWLPRVTVVLVGLAKGREGGDPGHDALLLVCCVCIIFFHLLSKL